MNENNQLEIEEAIDDQPSDEFVQEGEEIADEEQVAENLNYLIEMSGTTSQIAKAIGRVMHGMIQCSEAEIKRGARATKTDMVIRSKFWAEVARAEREKDMLRPVNIYRGTCTRQYWERVLKEQPGKLRYYLLQYQEYNSYNQLLIHLGQERMHDILTADPFIRKNGSRKKMLDPKIGALQVAVYKFVTENKYGKAIERKQIHTSDGGKTEEPKSLKELELEIAQLEKEFNDAVPVHAEVVSVE